MLLKKKNHNTIPSAIIKSFSLNVDHTEFEDTYGSISPDGKYFFFHRSYGGDRAVIFWVDAKVVFSLKNSHQNIKSTQ